MPPERLIGVVKNDHIVLHTFPVQTPEPDPPGDKIHEKALSAATHAQLVPAEELGKLSTREHVSRGGPFRPYGDSRDIMTETKEALEQSVRERAYHLWEQAGCPEGRAAEVWHQARDEHFRKRAYRLWEYEGRPEGQADRHWHWTRDYEDKRIHCAAHRAEGRLSDWPGSILVTRFGDLRAETLCGPIGAELSGTPSTARIDAHE